MCFIFIVFLFLTYGPFFHRIQLGWGTFCD
uniref:Uncharacterized protein n=1 Tax=Anguilla anguilla TaxID=7936 RepID=A0A0E9Y0Y7_ANGAN